MALVSLGYNSWRYVYVQVVLIHRTWLPQYPQTLCWLYIHCRGCFESMVNNYRWLVAHVNYLLVFSKVVVLLTSDVMKYGVFITLFCFWFLCTQNCRGWKCFGIAWETSVFVRVLSSVDSILIVWYISVNVWIIRRKLF